MRAVVCALMCILAAGDDVRRYSATPATLNVTVVGVTRKDGTSAQQEANVTVALTQQPAENVTVLYAAADTTRELSLSGDGAIEFTNSDWDVPQTFTATMLRPGADAFFDANARFSTIALSIDSDDVAYCNAPVVQSTVEHTWSTDPEIVVSDVFRTVLDERGVTTDGVVLKRDEGRTSFSVALAGEPSGNVEIPVASLDMDRVITSNCNLTTKACDKLTFTPASWAEPQTVVATAIDNDNVNHGWVEVIVDVGEAISGDQTFASKQGGDVLLQVVNDDHAGYTRAPALNATEGGVQVLRRDLGREATDSAPSEEFFTSLKLTSEPFGSVTITPSLSTGAAEVGVAPTAVAFTADTWNTTQTFTYTTQLADGYIDGQTETVVTYGVTLADSDDGVYAATVLRDLGQEIFLVQDVDIESIGGLISLTLTGGSCVEATAAGFPTEPGGLRIADKAGAEGWLALDVTVSPISTTEDLTVRVTSEDATRLHFLEPSGENDADGDPLYDILDDLTLTFAAAAARGGNSTTYSTRLRCPDTLVFEGGSPWPSRSYDVTAAASGYSNASSTAPVPVVDDEVLNIQVTPASAYVYEYGNPSENAVMGGGETTAVVFNLSASSMPDGPVVTTVGIEGDSLGTVYIATEGMEVPVRTELTLTFTAANYQVPQTVLVSANDFDATQAERDFNITWSMLAQTELPNGIQDGYHEKVGSVPLKVKQDLCDYFDWAHTQDKFSKAMNEGDATALDYPNALRLISRLPDDGATLLVGTTLYVDGHGILGGAGVPHGNVTFARNDGGASTDTVYQSVPAEYSFNDTDRIVAVEYGYNLYIKFTALEYDGATGMSGTDMVGLTCWRTLAIVEEMDEPHAGRLTASPASVREDGTLTLTYDIVNAANEVLTFAGSVSVGATLSGVSGPWAFDTGYGAGQTIEGGETSATWVLQGTRDGYHGTTATKQFTVAVASAPASIFTSTSLISIPIIDAEVPLRSEAPQRDLYEASGTQVTYTFAFTDTGVTLPHPVTITPQPDPGYEVTLSDAELVFSNAMETKVLTLTSIDDDFEYEQDERPDQTFTLSFDITSSDADYNGKFLPYDAVQTFLNYDDDENGAAVQVALVSGDINSFRETHGDQLPFTVRLAKSPVCNITIELALYTADDAEVPASDYPLYGFAVSGDGMAMTFSPDVVGASDGVLTPGNWATMQTVTLAADDDDYDDAAATLSLRLKNVSNDDGCAFTDNSYVWQYGWGGLPVTGVPVDIAFTDNDDTAGFTVTEPTTNITECGGEATFAIKLNSKPYADVLVAYAIGAEAGDEFTDNRTQGYFKVVDTAGHACPDASATDGGVRCFAGQLTFTASTWSTSQTVTVVGLDDSVDDDVRSILITRTVSSADAHYTEATNPVGPLTVWAEDDSDTMGVILDPVRLVLDERHGAGHFTARLTAKPAEAVHLHFSVDANSSGEVVVENGGPNATDPSATAGTDWFSIAPSSWDTVVTVDVRSVNDFAVDNDSLVEIAVGLAGGDVAAVTLPALEVVIEHKETVYRTNLQPTSFEEFQEVRAELRTVFVSANGADTPVPYLNVRDKAALRLVTYRFDPALGGEDCEGYRGQEMLTEVTEWGLALDHPADGPTLVSVAYATFTAPAAGTQFLVCFEHTMPRETYYIHSARNGALQVVTSAGKAGNDTHYTPSASHLHYYVPDPTVGQYAILQLLGGGNASDGWEFRYPKSSCATTPADCFDADTLKVVPAGRPCTYEHWTLGMAYFGSAGVDGTGSWLAAAELGLTEGTHAGGAAVFGTQYANPLVDTWTQAGGSSGANADNATTVGVDGYAAAEMAHAYLRLPKQVGEFEVCYSSVIRRAALQASGPYAYSIPMWQKVARCAAQGACSAGFNATTQHPREALGFSVGREPVGWSMVDLTPGTVGELVIDDSNQAQLDNSPHGLSGYVYSGAGSSGSAPTAATNVGTGEAMNHWAPRGGDTVKIVPEHLFQETAARSPRHDWDGGGDAYVRLAHAGSFPGVGCWDRGFERTNATSGRGWEDAGLPAAGYDGGSMRPLGSLDLRGDPSNPVRSAATEDAGGLAAAFAPIFLPTHTTNASYDGWFVCYRRTCNAANARCRRHSGYRVLPFHKAGVGQPPRHWLHLGDRYPYGVTPNATAGTHAPPAHRLVPGRYAGEFEDNVTAPLLNVTWYAPPAPTGTWAPLYIQLRGKEEPRRLDARRWDFDRVYSGAHPWDRVAYTHGSAVRLVRAALPCDYEAFPRDLQARVAAESTDGGTSECDNLHAHFDRHACEGSASDRVDLVNATFFVQMPDAGHEYAVCFREGGRNWRKVPAWDPTGAAEAELWPHPFGGDADYAYGTVDWAGADADAYAAADTLYNFSMGGEDVAYEYDPYFAWNDTNFDWGPWYEQGMPVWGNASAAGGAYWADYGPDAESWGKAQYYPDEKPYDPDLPTAAPTPGIGVGKGRRGSNRWRLTREARIWWEYHHWADHDDVNRSADVPDGYWAPRFNATATDGYLTNWTGWDNNVTDDYQSAEWVTAMRGATPAPPTPVPPTPAPPVPPVPPVPNVTATATAAPTATATSTAEDASSATATAGNGTATATATATGNATGANESDAGRRAGRQLWWAPPVDTVRARARGAHTQSGNGGAYEYAAVDFYGYNYSDYGYEHMVAGAYYPEYEAYAAGAAADPVTPAAFDAFIEDGETQLLSVLPAHPVELVSFDERRSGYEALIVVHDPTGNVTSAPRLSCGTPRRCVASGDVVRVVPEVGHCDVNPRDWHPSDSDMRLGLYDAAGIVAAVAGTRLHNTKYYNATPPADTVFTEAWGRDSPGEFKKVVPATEDFAAREYAAAGVVLPLAVAAGDGEDGVASPTRYRVCYKQAGQSHWHMFNFTLAPGPGMRVAPRPGSHYLLTGETKTFTLFTEAALPDDTAGIELYAKLVFWPPHWTTEQNKACQASPPGSTEGELAASATTTFTKASNVSLTFDLTVPHKAGPHALCVQLVTPESAAHARASWWRPGDATQPSYIVMDNGLRWFVEPGQAPTNLGASEVSLIQCRPTPYGYCSYADTDEDAFQTDPGGDRVKIIPAAAKCPSHDHVGVADPPEGLDDLGPADGPTDVATFRVTFPAAPSDVPASYKVCVQTTVTGRGFRDVARWFEVEQAQHLPHQMLVYNTATQERSFTTTPAYVKAWRLEPGTAGTAGLAPQTSVLLNAPAGSVALAGALTDLGEDEDGVARQGFWFQLYSAGGAADAAGEGVFKLVPAKVPAKAADQTDAQWGDTAAWVDLKSDCSAPAYPAATNEGTAACAPANNFTDAAAVRYCPYAAPAQEGVAEFHAVFHLPLAPGAYHVCYRRDSGSAWLGLPPAGAAAGHDPFLYTHPTFLGLHQTGLDPEVDEESPGLPPVNVVDLRTMPVPGGGLASAARWCTEETCESPDRVAVVNASQLCPAADRGVWHAVAPHGAGQVRIPTLDSAEAAFNPAFASPSGQYRVCVFKSRRTVPADGVEIADVADAHVVPQEGVVYQLQNYGPVVTGGGSGFWRAADTAAATGLTVMRPHEEADPSGRFIEYDEAKHWMYDEIPMANLTDPNGDISRSVMVENGRTVVYDVSVVSSVPETVTYGTWAIEVQACNPALSWAGVPCSVSRPVAEAGHFHLTNVRGDCDLTRAGQYGWSPHGLTQFTAGGTTSFALQYQSACPPGTFGCGIRFCGTVPVGMDGMLPSGGGDDDGVLGGGGGAAQVLYSRPQWVNVKKKFPKGVAIDGRVAVSEYVGDDCRAGEVGEVVSCYKRTCDSGVECVLTFQTLSEGAPQTAPRGSLTLTYSDADYADFPSPPDVDLFDSVRVPADVDTAFGSTLGLAPLLQGQAWRAGGTAAHSFVPVLAATLTSSTVFFTVEYGDGAWTRFAVEVVRRQPVAGGVVDIETRDVALGIAGIGAEREPVPHPDVRTLPGGDAEVEMYLEALMPYRAVFAMDDADGAPLTETAWVLAEWELSTTLRSNRVGVPTTRSRVVAPPPDPRDVMVTTDALLATLEMTFNKEAALTVDFRVHVVDNACSRFNNVDAERRGCKLGFVFSRGGAQFAAYVWAVVRLPASDLEVALVDEPVAGNEFGTVYHTPLVEIVPGMHVPGGGFVRDEFHFGEVFALLDNAASRDGLTTPDGFRLLEDITRAREPVDLSAITWNPCGGGGDCDVHTYSFGMFSEWAARFRLRANMPCYDCAFRFYSTWGAASTRTFEHSFRDVALNDVYLSCENKRVEIRAAAGEVGAKTDTFAVTVQARRVTESGATASAVWPRWWVMTDLNSTAYFRRLEFPPGTVPGTSSDGLPDGDYTGVDIPSLPNGVTSTRPALVPLLQQEDLVGNIVTARMGDDAAVTFPDLFFHDNVLAASKAVPFPWALDGGNEVYALRFHTHGVRYAPDGMEPRVLVCEAQVSVEQIYPAVFDEGGVTTVETQISLADVRPANQKCSPGASGAVECIYWASDTQFASDGLTFTVEFNTVTTKVGNQTGTVYTTVEPETGRTRNVTIVPVSGQSVPRHAGPAWGQNPAMQSENTGVMTLDSSFHTVPQPDQHDGKYYTYGNLTVVASRPMTSVRKPAHRHPITLEYAPAMAQSPARRVAFKLCDASPGLDRDVINNDLCVDVLVSIVPETATVKLALFKQPTEETYAAGYGADCRGDLVEEVLAVPYFEQPGVSMRLYAYLWPLTFSLTTVGAVGKQVLTWGDRHPAADTLYKNNTVADWDVRTALQESPDVATRGDFTCSMKFYGVEEMPGALGLLVKVTSTFDDSVDAQVVSGREVLWQRPLDETLSTWSVSDAVRYDTECFHKRWLQTYGAEAGAELSANYRQFAHGAGQGWSYLTPAAAGIPFPIETVVTNTDGARAHSFTDGTVVKIQKRAWDSGCNDGGALTVFELAPSPLDATEVMIPGNPYGPGWVGRADATVRVQRGVATAWPVFSAPCEKCTLELNLCYPGASAATCFDAAGDTPSDLTPIFADRTKITKPFTVVKHRVDAVIVRRQHLPVVASEYQEVTQRNVEGTAEEVGAPYAFYREKVLTGAPFEIGIDTIQEFPGAGNVWTMVEPPGAQRWKRQMHVTTEYIGTRSRFPDVVIPRPSYANGGFLLDARNGGYLCGRMTMDDLERSSTNEAVALNDAGEVKFAFTRPCAACRVTLHYKLTSPDGGPATSGHIALLNSAALDNKYGAASDGAAERAVFQVVTCGIRWAFAGRPPMVAQRRKAFALSLLWTDGFGFPTEEASDAAALVAKPGVGNGGGGAMEVRSPVMRAGANGLQQLSVAPSPRGTATAAVTFARACFQCGVAFGRQERYFALVTEPTQVIAIPTSEADMLQWNVGVAEWTFEVYWADEYGDRAYGVGANRYLALESSFTKVGQTELAPTLALTASHTAFDATIPYQPSIRVENGVPNVVNSHVDPPWPNWLRRPLPGQVVVRATTPFFDVELGFGLDGTGLHAGLPTVLPGGVRPPVIGLSVLPSNLTLEWTAETQTLHAYAVGIQPQGAFYATSAWSSTDPDDDARLVSWSCDAQACTYSRGEQRAAFALGVAHFPIAVEVGGALESCTCTFTVTGGAAYEVDSGTQWEASVSVEFLPDDNAEPGTTTAPDAYDPGTQFSWRWLGTETSEPIVGNRIETVDDRWMDLTLQVLDTNGKPVDVSQLDIPNGFRAALQFDASVVPADATGTPCFQCKQYSSVTNVGDCEIRISTDAALGLTLTMMGAFQHDGAERASSCRVPGAAFPTLQQWEFMLAYEPWRSIEGFEVAQPPALTADLVSVAYVLLITDVNNLPDALGTTWEGHPAHICGRGTHLRFAVYDHDDNVVSRERHMKAAVTADRFGIATEASASGGYIHLDIDSPHPTRDAECEMNRTLRDADACTHTPLRLTIEAYGESAATGRRVRLPVRHEDRIYHTSVRLLAYFLRSVARLVAYAPLGVPCTTECLPVPEGVPEDALSVKAVEMINAGWVPLQRDPSATRAPLFAHGGRDPGTGAHPARWMIGQPFPEIAVFKVDASYRIVSHPEDLFAAAAVRVHTVAVPCRSVDEAWMLKLPDHYDECSSQYRLDGFTLCGSPRTRGLPACGEVASTGWQIGGAVHANASVSIGPVSYGATDGIPNDAVALVAASGPKSFRLALAGAGSESPALQPESSGDVFEVDFQEAAALLPLGERGDNADCTAPDRASGAVTCALADPIEPLEPFDFDVFIADKMGQVLPSDNVTNVTLDAVCVTDRAASVLRYEAPGRGVEYVARPTFSATMGVVSIRGVSFTGLCPEMQLRVQCTTKGLLGCKLKTLEVTFPVLYADSNQTAPAIPEVVVTASCLSMGSAVAGVDPAAQPRIVALQHQKGEFENGMGQVLAASDRVGQVYRGANLLWACVTPDGQCMGDASKQGGECVDLTITLPPPTPAPPTPAPTATFPPQQQRRRTAGLAANGTHGRAAALLQDVSYEVQTEFEIRLAAPVAGAQLTIISTISRDLGRGNQQSILQLSSTVFRNTNSSSMTVLVPETPQPPVPPTPAPIPTSGTPTPATSSTPAPPPPPSSPPTPQPPPTPAPPTPQPAPRTAVPQLTSAPLTWEPMVGGSGAAAGPGGLLLSLAAAVWAAAVFS